MACLSNQLQLPPTVPRHAAPLPLVKCGSFVPEATRAAALSAAGPDVPTSAPQSRAGSRGPGIVSLLRLLAATSSASINPTSSLRYRALTRHVFVSYCQPSFDDSQWRSVDVPHDFVVEGAFSSSADQAHGYLPFGVGWYRKHIDLPSPNMDAVYELTLDGVQVRSSRQLSRCYLT